MASYYINTDTGNDTTGDGSSGNPWQTLLHAFTNSTNADIIYISGVAPADLTSAFDCINRVLIQNPLDTDRTSTVRLDETGSHSISGSLIINLKIDLTNSGTLYLATSYTTSSCHNCFIYNNSGINRTTDSFQVRLVSRATNMTFNYCDFDFTDITGDLMSSTSTYGAGTFSGCSFYNIAGTTQYICNGNNAFFTYCKFYAISGTGAIINNSSTIASQNNSTITHCSFLIGSAAYNMINNTTNGGNTTFNANIINGDGATASLFSSVTENMTGIVGNNCLFTVSTGASYDNLRTLTDYADTVSSFKSTNPLDSDFLEISNTSNGKNGDSFNSNLDCGAVQGTALTDYPAEADVLSGVDYNFGNNTGTLILPTPPNNYDLREGVVVGAVTGILKVPTAGQVEEGVEFDRTDTPITGTLTPLSPQLGPFTVTVYTSDGSNISGTTLQPTITVEVDSGTLVNTILSDLGASETYESGTTLIRNASNARRLDIRIDR